MKCFSAAASLWFRCCLSSYTLGRVCVCDCVCSALVCSTCVWHYCDKAAQPLRGDGECQRPEQRSEQLPNIWMEWETHWLDGWPASPQRGSRAKGGGQVKNPKMCVWNITLSVFSLLVCTWTHEIGLPRIRHICALVIMLLCLHSHYWVLS